MRQIRKRRVRFTIGRWKSSARTRSIAVELAEDMEGGDEADEAEAHDEHHRRRDLQAGSVIGVESQHVAASAGASSDGGGAVSAAGAEAATAHACGGGSGAAGSDDAWARVGGGGGLRLRGASRHDEEQGAKITRGKMDRRKKRS